MVAKRYIYSPVFELENGQSLSGIEIAYHTYGKLNTTGDNVVWICHALTANSDAMDWWSGLVGFGKLFDPEKYFIVCANILGSCYGSSGPLSKDPSTGVPYYSNFPQITIRDMVRAHQLLRKHLNVHQIALCVGGSMGGYQVLEWLVMEPGLIRKSLLLATGACESAWGIAIHTAQRMAIESDVSWREAQPSAGAIGLRTARAIGMLTYRNYRSFVERQTDPDSTKLDHFKASSYILYQGEKLMKRFNAYSYWLLTKAMDSHNLARGRASIPELLATISSPTLIIGLSSDLLCPVEEQLYLAKHMPAARFELIDSPYGHDGFLIEWEIIEKKVKDFF